MISENKNVISVIVEKDVKKSIEMASGLLDTSMSKFSSNVIKMALHDAKLLVLDDHEYIKIKSSLELAGNLLRTV
jgi:uncharacterized protein (DUF1778 family)